jgi:hypothetical protein
MELSIAQLARVRIGGEPPACAPAGSATPASASTTHAHFALCPIHSTL